MKVEQNIERLNYLLQMYQMQPGSLLALASEGLKIPLTQEDIFSDEIDINHLKRVDKVFNKGLSFYLDPKKPEFSRESSIFFRKQKFGADLNLASKQAVARFEELKISISALAKLSGIEFRRQVPVFKLEDDPREVSRQMRQVLYPNFRKQANDFFKNLVGKFADQNIMVFELVEHHARLEKVNIDGFFLQPNVLVVKRQEKGYSREIFTLCHELAHYLLNEEEIEQLDILDSVNHPLSKVERWCNDFAYYFLAGDFATRMDALEPAHPQKNDYHHAFVSEMKRATHLSRMAIFTRLLLQKKISNPYYYAVKANLEDEYQQQKAQEESQRKLANDEGRQQFFASATPVRSPLLVLTVQKAYFDGIISEHEACEKLHLDPKKFEKYFA